MTSKLITMIFMIVSICFSNRTFTQNPVWTQDGTNIYPINTGNVGIGTTSPDTKLTVNGKIHAEELIVNMNIPGPDYVFETGYSLMPLDKLDNYLQTHNHLPEIPSAINIKQNGIGLSEMSMLLLKKTEELTLYIIDHEKRINNLIKNNN